MSTPFKNPTKHRGASSNPVGRFEKTSAEYFDDGWALEEETLPFLQTTVFPEQAKSIISRNDSPDLGFDQSINPYRGCEHGCIYCYARPSHAYVNLYSSGDVYHLRRIYMVYNYLADEKKMMKFNSVSVCIQRYPLYQESLFSPH